MSSWADEYEPIRQAGMSRGIVDTIWSLEAIFMGFDSEAEVDMNAPLPKRYRDKKTLVYRPHFGFGKAREKYSASLKGVETWLDLWEVADKLIAESGDTHHLFIEGFSAEMLPSVKSSSELTLYTGS